MAAGQRNRPDWQAEDCPPWCAREHLNDDHPEDRIHQSEPRAVPALRRRSLLPEDRPERTELEITIASTMASSSSARWIMMGEGEGPALLILDEASTAGLIASLQRLLR